MSSLSVPVHLSVMTCAAQRQLLLETAENLNFGTESERNFLCPCLLHRSTFQFRAVLNQHDTCVNGVWNVLIDFATLNKQKSAIKSPDKKSAIFCRGFFVVW